MKRIMHFALYIALLFFINCCQIAYTDPAIVNISSVAWREISLKKTINSLLPQADKINVFLQQYKLTPSFLNHPKINVVHGQDYPEALQLRDAAKFFWAGKEYGYLFFVDDDIIYPKSYIKYCIKKIEQYKRKAAVGFHGVIFPPNLAKWSERTVYNFQKPLASDTFVHCLGTGVLAFHSDTIKITIDDFLIKNMADIWFAIQAKQQKVPLVCLPRPNGYLIDIEQASSHPQSIQNQSKAETIKIINQYGPWILTALKLLQTF